MTKPLGRPFVIARRLAASESWVVHALVGVGICVSVGLVGVSALLNFRMGYRSADTELDGWVYGMGAGLGDALKAIAPFMLAWGLKNRDWLAAVCAAVVFSVLTAYSFTAALGFAASHRANKAAETLHQIESRGDLRKDKDRIDARLGELGTQRSSAEVEQAIVTAYRQPAGDGKRSVGEISKKCTLNRASTRAACQAIGKLAEELARAQESEKLQADGVKLRELLVGKSVSSSPDPQVDALKRLSDLTLKVDREDINLGLAVLLALLIELGSGLGLYIVTTPYRNRHEPQQAGNGKGGGAEKGQGKETRLADVDIFAVERLEHVDQGEVGLPDVYADYVVWARWRGEVPYGRRQFGRRFSEMARAVGMRTIYRERTEIYLDMALVGR